MSLNASVSRGLVSGIIAGLASVLVVGLCSTTHNTALAAVRPSGGEHRVVFVYWTEEEGFASSVVLNNASAAPLIVRPTLHASDGIRRIEVEPVDLQPHHSQRFEIKEWLTLNGESAPFGSGSLSLSFDAPYPSLLGAQVSIVKSGSSLSFDVPPAMPAAFASSELEGFLWVGSGADSRVVLTNTSNASVNIEAILTANELPAVTRQLTLSALETRVIRTDQLGAPVSPYDRSTQVGGISLSHSGRPGDVMAFCMFSRPDVGFSTQVLFDDPATRQSNRLVATHVPIGVPDVAGYPAGTQFKAVAVLRNSSPDAIDVATTVSYFGSDGFRSQALEVRHLESRQILVVDLNAELRRLGSAGPLRGVGVTFKATGDSGSVLAHLVSVDNSGTHVFTVPLKDPQIAMNRSGNYPWSIEGNDESVVYVRNTSDQESRFVIQLDHADGSYTLPLQVIAPQQEIAFDIRQLRDGKVPDSLDRLLPETLRTGRAIWFESGPQALIGRLEIRNVAAGTVKSFSCGGPTCPCAPDTFIVTVSSNRTNGVIGETTKSKLLETRSDDCGNIFGPYDVTSQAVWSSSNTAVVTVGPLTTTGMTSRSVGLGTANVIANYNGASFAPNPDSGTGCQFTALPVSDVQSMNVYTLRFSLAGSSVPVDVTATSAAALANEGVQLTVEAVGAGGTVVTNVNDSFGVLASRTLAGSEVGLPTTIQLSNGRYSRGLVLNRVNGTERGTSFRFARSTLTIDFYMYTYFRVVSSREGLVGGTTGCGHVITPNDNFVALPVGGLCNRAVVVRNATTLVAMSSTKKDAGPHFPGGRCDPGSTTYPNGDPYWNTGTRPLVETLSCEQGNNNAGIDLADGLYFGLGSPSMAAWRWN